MRLGARVIDYSAGIIKFSPNFLRFGARRYCFTVEEMSVSSLYWFKWLKRVMLFEFDRVFKPRLLHSLILSFTFCGRFLTSSAVVQCTQNANILSCGFIEMK